ncbi:MAG: hypothetical protein J6O51_05745 [Bacteroidales bacterium]|nr:hypothetical protein [Bacteroidales bacterium]
MKIIIEAGATKSDWRLISGSEQLKSQLFPGMNVSTIAMEHNLDTLTHALDELGRPQLEGLYLYTAGIVTPQVSQNLEARIRSLIQVDEVEIKDDLIAAARAVCGRQPGIVAILGTGSNACFWDGSSVSFKVRSGGYILGDEGGGATLGRLFLSDYIKGLVPDEVAADFASRFDASYEGIVALVYRSEAPAAALGRLAPFILSHYSDPYIKELVDGNFRSFIRRSLLRYDFTHYRVGVVGGLGSACRDIFSRLCEQEGVRLGSFEAEPINGLLKFHSI